MEGSCLSSVYCSEGQFQYPDYPHSLDRCVDADLLVLKSYCVTFVWQERMGAYIYSNYKDETEQALETVKSFWLSSSHFIHLLLESL